MLTLVLWNARVAESADLGVIAQNSIEGRGSASMKARNKKNGMRHCFPIVFDPIIIDKEVASLKIALVATVRASLAELLIFVQHHLHLGLSDVFLFFDDPEDPGFAVFSNWVGVTAVRCDQSYWSDQRPAAVEERQWFNLESARLSALEKGCQWLIPIDSDELLRPIGSIQALLSKTPSDQVCFSPREAISSKVAYENIFEPVWFRRPPRPWQAWLAQKLGAKGAFYRGEYFRGHSASKVAVRIDRQPVKIRNHGAVGLKFPLAKSDTSQVRLLHYDCVGVDSWKTKWTQRLDGAGRFITMRLNRTQQMEDFSRARQEGELAQIQLFRRVQMLSKRAFFVLLVLGLVTIDFGIARELRRQSKSLPRRGAS